MRCAVLGRSGFIGKALWKRLQVRDDVFSYLRPDLDVVFFFSSPSSQILFNYAPDYCYNETVQGFGNVLEFCRQNKIKLIYPTTASFNNLYANCKRTLEFLQDNCDYKNILSCRISAGYGQGEDHKQEYSSVVYQFCKIMKEGKKPVIFGDGSQTRDFIYIDDIVDGILNNIGKRGEINISTGVNTSFNELVKIINKELGTDIEPMYVDKPLEYLEETICESDIPINYPLSKGVAKLCESII